MPLDVFVPTIKREMIVPYSAEAMFKLINQIENYPQFLPWCRHARILEQNAQEIKATLVLAKGGLHKAFTTCNHLTPYHRIAISLIDGPFKQLEGQWQFDAINAQECHIHFELSFEFSTKLLALMFGPVFQQATNTLVDAFQQEANKRYG